MRRMPAEWEPQWGVQLTWPHRDTDWAPMLTEIEQVYWELAREIALRERLVVVADPHCLLPDHLRADIARIASNDTWARDHGFITVVEDGRQTLLDFCFNGWGKKFESAKDNAINQKLFQEGILPSSGYESHLDFVLEGGSIESDGCGTIFTTEGCLMAPHRNQPLSKGEIDTRLKRWLGAERVVWLQHGHLAGDDTDGHIDTLVRVAPDDTLIYNAPPTDATDEHFADLSALQEELRNLRTLDGRPYRLLPLPLPSPVVADGERLPVTYANYLVVNGAVLVPTYGQLDFDREALQTIKRAFPDREMVAIDCRPVVRQHGSLHCCTMQYYNFESTWGQRRTVPLWQE